MKKHFLGLSVIVFAFVLVAFTPPKAKPTVDDLYVFEFDDTQSGGYSQTNVENESSTYWKFVGMNEELCDNELIKACRIAVTADYVNNPSNPTALKDVTISATESSTGIAYVTGVTDAPSVNQFSNRE